MKLLWEIEREQRDRQIVIVSDVSFISNGLKLLSDVGLDYLTLGQPLSTLSGGENQRLKLASKLNKKGDIFILDEPTKGLHFQDIDYLLKLIQKLIKNKNSIIIVEHNIEIIKNSDWIIELGYGAGKDGGEIIFEGTFDNIVKDEKSIIGKYLFRDTQQNLAPNR